MRPHRFLLALLLCISAHAEDSPILLNQFRADIQHMVSEKSPHDPDKVEALVDRLIQQIKQGDPERFAVSKAEKALLSENGQVVSDDEFAKCLEEVEGGRNPELPAMLAWYLKDGRGTVLNPAQRLLAYRLMKSLLDQP